MKKLPLVLGLALIAGPAFAQTDTTPPPGSGIGTPPSMLPGTTMTPPIAPPPASPPPSTISPGTVTPPSSGSGSVTTPPVAPPPIMTPPK